MLSHYKLSEDAREAEAEERQKAANAREQIRRNQARVEDMNRRADEERKGRLLLLNCFHVYISLLPRTVMPSHENVACSNDIYARTRACARTTRRRHSRVDSR